MLQPWKDRVRPRVFCKAINQQISVQNKALINVEHESSRRLPLAERQPSPVPAVSVCLALSMDFIGDGDDDVRFSCPSLSFVELTCRIKFFMTFVVLLTSNCNLGD